MEKKITLPTAEDEALLDDIICNSTDYVQVRKKKYGIKWLRRGTIRKFTSILLKPGDDDKVSCKCAATIILNGFFKVNLFYWFLWRWFYYIKQYGDNELAPVIAIAKKKIPVKSYFAATILLTAMKDTMMQMTREEASNILHAPTTGKAGK